MTGASLSNRMSDLVSYLPQCIPFANVIDRMKAFQIERLSSRQQNE
jgi:hypothetical protein